ncbi:MAG: isocitrate lyase/phosphoenolpyruvate mutase family protein [Alphaproteobacteria bacterium]|nr:isocitrate lyase/phosphoenolpyruvate mutase family protein [Alphaproteobacteria bacterium]
MTPGGALRARLQKGVLVAPGAYDALTARIATQAGAEAVYMTGFGVAGSLLGVPDIGIVTATEMIDRVRALSAASAPVPLIADGDNGHGGTANVERLVRAYEQAGAACIQLEDQVLPKRCGHMDGKEVVSLEEGATKIRAAVRARTSRDFQIMARTDARSVLGFDEALRRADAYLEAGADLLFVEAPQSETELRTIAQRFKNVPLVANMVEDGKTPMQSAADLGALGFRLVLFPISALLAAARTAQRVYAGLLAKGAPDPEVDRVTFQAYNEIVGLSAYLKRE